MKIKNGSFRITFVIGKYAIKVPRLRQWRYFLQAILMNIYEKEWSKVDDYDLCPVYFSFLGLINIMPYCKPITEKEYKKLKMYKFIGLSENKISSFGKYKNKIVAVDYGDMFFYAKNANRFIKSIKREIIIAKNINNQRGDI